MVVVTFSPRLMAGREASATWLRRQLLRQGRERGYAGCPITCTGSAARDATHLVPSSHLCHSSLRHHLDKRESERERERGADRQTQRETDRDRD